jgi:hypothetical protein
MEELEKLDQIDDAEESTAKRDEEALAGDSDGVRWLRTLRNSFASRSTFGFETSLK